MGYAMGYEGSWAMDEDEDEGIRRGYVRDRMKRGVHGEVWGSSWQ